VAEIQELLEQVKANAGELLARGANHPAYATTLDALVDKGAHAVRPVLDAMHGQMPRNQDPREVIEALGWVLGQIAARDVGPLLEVLVRDDVPPDPQMTFVVLALRHSKDERAMDAVIAALKHPSQTVRHAAADVLAQGRGKRVVTALLDALRDRSSSVKFVAVEAMHRRADLRDPRALDALRRIVATPSLRQRSPGMVRMAQEVIARIRPTRPA